LVYIGLAHLVGVDELTVIRRRVMRRVVGR
jgi:hypothetical protein